MILKAACPGIGIPCFSRAPRGPGYLSFPLQQGFRKGGIGLR